MGLHRSSSCSSCNTISVLTVWEHQTPEGTYRLHVWGSQNSHVLSSSIHRHPPAAGLKSWLQKASLQSRDTASSVQGTHSASRGLNPPWARNCTLGGTVPDRAHGWAGGNLTLQAQQLVFNVLPRAPKGMLRPCSILNSFLEMATWSRTPGLQVRATQAKPNLEQCRKLGAAVTACPASRPALLPPAHSPSSTCSAAPTTRLCSLALTQHSTSCRWDSQGSGILPWCTLLLTSESCSGIKDHPISKACKNIHTATSLSFWKG